MSLNVSDRPNNRCSDAKDVKRSLITNGASFANNMNEAKQPPATVLIFFG